MSRFDLYKGRDGSDYFLDVQTDFLAQLHSRMVIPVVKARRMSHVIPHLHLKVDINGVPHYLVTNMMGAMPSRGLGRPVGSLTHLSYDITAAIDFLLQGF